MFGRRGQGAMEYLMTYGWAILVVMIVGIVMWQLGIFNMGGTTVTATGFAKIKPQLAASGLAATGPFRGTFTNGVGTTIQLQTFTVTGVDLTAAGCLHGVATADPITGDGLDNADFGAAGGNIGAGDNFLVYIPGCYVGGGGAGDIYDINVEFEYDVTIGDATVRHTESGSFRGPLE